MGASLGPYLVPIVADWSDWAVLMVTIHFSLVLGLFVAHKGPALAQTAPFEGPGAPRRAHSSRIKSQKPQVAESFDRSYDRFANILNFGPI